MTFADVCKIRLRAGAVIAPLLMVYACLVFAGVWGGVELVHLFKGIVAVIWIPNAVMVIFALRMPQRPLREILGIGFIASVAGQMAATNAFDTAVVLSLCNLVEVLIVVLPFRSLDIEKDFVRTKTLLIFYGLSMCVAPVISASMASLYLHAHFGLPVMAAARAWYAGNALWLAILVPPFLMARTDEFANMFKPGNRAVTLLLFGIVGAVIVASSVVQSYPMAILFFPVVLILTFARGFAGGLIGLMLAACYLIVRTLLGLAGPGLVNHALPEQIMIVQIFGTAISFSIVLVGAVLNNRRRLEREMALALERAEEAREEALVAKNAAESASQSKSMFLANMSHELRTPLNAVIGFSEIMESEMFGPLGDPHYRDYARTIREAGAHLLELINDVLDMSKIEAGKYEIRRERIDVTVIVGDCVKLISARADSAGLRLVTKMPPEPIWLNADRRALKQILLNLLSNAVKFTPQGGEISVAARLHEEGRDRTCMLSVSDTGVGIPAHAIERLGNPFVQLRNGADRTHKGTGLGLALVRALSEMHLGAMWIESVEGAGTTVRVEIPVTHLAAVAA